MPVGDWHGIIACTRQSLRALRHTPVKQRSARPSTEIVLFPNHRFQGLGKLATIRPQSLSKLPNAQQRSQRTRLRSQGDVARLLRPPRIHTQVELSEMNALYGVEAAALNWTAALHVQWNVTLWREVIDTIVVEEMVTALGARYTEAITAGESVRCLPSPFP